MRSIARTTTLAAAALLLAGSAWAADGVLIVQKLTFNSNPPQTHQIQIEQKRMRTQSTGPDGKSIGIMFDSAHQVMTIITEANQTYMELTKADMEAMSAQMTGAMAQMQEALKNMPPEQRARMEAMMKGRMGGAGAAATPAAKPVFHKTGTATVGKWTCDKYEGMTNGQKTHEICTVDPKALGFSAADFQVTRDMMEFFKEFQKFQPGGGQQTSQLFAMGTPEDQGFSGVPVRSVTTTANGNTSTFEITEVSRQSFPESTFQVPAGFKKVDMGGLGRRGR